MCLVKTLISLIFSIHGLQSLLWIVISEDSDQTDLGHCKDHFVAYNHSLSQKNHWLVMLHFTNCYFLQLEFEFRRAIGLIGLMK